MGRQELAQERERNGRLVDKLREQVELVQQTKRLLLAVGIGSGDGSSASATAALRRDWAPSADGTPARPDAADPILPGTDEWEALLRERVRRDLALEKELRAAQDRCASRARARARVQGDGRGQAGGGRGQAGRVRGQAGGGRVRWQAGCFLECATAFWCCGYEAPLAPACLRS